MKNLTDLRNEMAEEHREKAARVNGERVAIQNYNSFLYAWDCLLSMLNEAAGEISQFPIINGFVAGEILQGVDGGLRREVTKLLGALERSHARIALAENQYVECQKMLEEAMDRLNDNERSAARSIKEPEDRLRER